MPAPMTYLVNGKQYLVLAVGGGTYPAEILAYTLLRDGAGHSGDRFGR
jgi:hypothetical protein